ncbi:zinc finger protein ZAT9-like [Wolffia australiana]
MDRRAAKLSRRAAPGPVGSAESEPSLEPVSSLSEAPPDDDVARCLMMLSRDFWLEGEAAAVGVRRGDRAGKHRCGSCGKAFRSYQALGGHRASHKKIKGPPESPVRKRDRLRGDTEANPGRRIHECPVCFRVFSSGQALGGHKRSHLLGRRSGFLDLNQPPPGEHEEELSAVSDGLMRESL